MGLSELLASFIAGAMRSNNAHHVFRGAFCDLLDVIVGPVEVN